MLKISEKFFSKLQKLDKYCILKQEDDLIIVGTKLIIKEHQEMLGNIFQPRTQNVDREVPVFFIIAMYEVPPSTIKLFKNKNLPILYLNKLDLAKSADGIKEILDKFVATSIKT